MCHQLFQSITDHKGEIQGTLALSIQPCNKAGSPLGEDFYIEEPAELLAHPYGFKVVLLDAHVDVFPYA